MGHKLFWINRNRKRYTPPVTQLQVATVNNQTGTAATVHNLTGVPAGALLVLMTGNQNSNGNATVFSSPALTWTKQADTQGALLPNNEIWTAVFTAGGDIDVTSNWGATRQSSTLVVMTGQPAVFLGNVVVSAVRQDLPNQFITTQSTNSIILVNSSNWNAVTGARTYIGAGEELYHTAHAEASFTRYQYTALTAQQYQVGMTAPDDGDEGYSTTVIEILNGDLGPDLTPPSTPTLSSPGHGATTVTLSWTAATDNVGVTGYEIYKDGVLLATTAALTYTAVGLTASTLYNFYVRAKDLSGNGTNSSTVGVTTSSSPGGGGGTIDSDSFTLTARTDDFPRPWGGMESWNKQSGSVQTVPQVPGQLSFYRRYTFYDMQNDDGSMNWTKFDNDWRQAAIEGKKFAPGFFACYPYGDVNNSHNKSVRYDNAQSAYPLALHQQMQAEPVKDWVSNKNGCNDWVPNFNSPSYKAWMNNLYSNVNGRIQTATYTPTTGPNAGKICRLKDMISYIDVRGHGSYGEWHCASIVDNAWEVGTFQDGGLNGDFPVGTKATIQTMKDLIDIHVANFNDFWGCIIFNVFDNNRFRNTRIDNEVGKHALTVTTARGPLGWRRDQWSDNKNYYWYLSFLHEGTYSPGVSMASKIMNVWKVAPITGEPPGYQDGDTVYNGHHMGYMTDGPAGGISDPLKDGQVPFYHASMVGNGNYGGLDMGSAGYAASRTEMVNAAKLMGSRLQVQGGTMNLNSSDFTLGLAWQEMGIAPQYDKWDVTFELRSGSTVLWSSISDIDLEKYLPTGSFATFTDIFPNPNLSPGTYNLYLIIRERKNYWKPYPLNNTGQLPDGSFFLCTVTYPVLP